MRLISLEINNYKCHRSTILSNLGNFHCVIGANGSGKTSILQLADILKRIPEQLDEAIEIVSGKIIGDEYKTIQFILIFELTVEEQRKFYNYLRLPDQDEIRSIMKRVKITFSMNVRKGQKYGGDNQLHLTGMEISDTANQTFISILGLKDPEKMKIEIAQFDGQLLDRGSIANNSLVDNHLKKSLKSEVDAKGYFASKPNNSLPYDFVQYFLSNLRYVPAIRESEKVIQLNRMDSEDSIATSGSNISQYIHTLYQNDNKRFLEISNMLERIFPDIPRIHPYLLQSNQITLASDKRYYQNILLKHEASGLEQFLIILWKIESSAPGTIWFVDEPELHLHPGAQKALFEFFLDQQSRGKQILVGTHSLIFIYKCDPNQISILFNKEGYTRNSSLENLIQAEKVTTKQQEIPIIKTHVFEALGYDPAFGFEAKNIVVVEGKTDSLIIRAFAATLEVPVDSLTTFVIPLGNKLNVEKYIPIFAYTLTGKNCLIVLDNDLKKPSELRDKIKSKETEWRALIGEEQEKPLLTDENFYLFPEHVYSIEYYLLEAEALCRAASQTDGQVLDKIRKTVEEGLEQIRAKKMTPKQLLGTIWESLLLGAYDEVDTAELIAKNVSKEHLLKYPEITNLINSMKQT